ncbi:MAG: helix-turn-helix transcriptional regulator [Bacillota bacterium]
MEEYTGIPDQTLSGQENGRAAPPRDKLASLCKLYSVSAGRFLNVRYRRDGGYCSPRCTRRGMSPVATSRSST